MHAVTMQVAIQAATVAVRAMKEADSPAETHTRRSSLEQLHRPRQAGQMLSQPAFNSKVQYRYVELLNFKMEVTNLFQAIAYDLNDDDKVLIIKNWLDREGSQFIQTLNNTEKIHAKMQQDCSVC